MGNRKSQRTAEGGHPQGGFSESKPRDGQPNRLRTTFGDFKSIRSALIGGSLDTKQVMQDSNPTDSDASAFVGALFSRSESEIVSLAKEAFRQKYPDATDAMLETAVFHVYRDGIHAAMDWLAAAEKFLRDPQSGIDYGATSHLIYHLYNWLQFQSLMPLGRCEFLEHLKDAELFLNEENPKAALDVIQRLIEHATGDVAPPSIG